MNVKIFISTVCMVFIYQHTVAQIQKGSIVIEGGFSYNRYKQKSEFVIGIPSLEEKYRYSIIGVRPRIGFFLSPSVQSGVGLNYEYNSMHQQSFYNGDLVSRSERKSHVYLINPYIRKFSRLGDKFYFTSTLNVAVGTGKMEYLQGANEVESKLFDWRVNLTPGLAYFMSDQWAVTVSFGQLFYDQRRETLESGGGFSGQPVNKTNTSGLSFQFSTLSVGIQYYIGNKSE